MTYFTCRQCGFRGRAFMGAAQAHETAAKQLHNDQAQYRLRQRHDALELKAILVLNVNDAEKWEAFKTANPPTLTKPENLIQVPQVGAR